MYYRLGLSRLRPTKEGVQSAAAVLSGPPLIVPAHLCTCGVASPQGAFLTVHECVRSCVFAVVYTAPLSSLSLRTVDVDAVRGGDRRGCVIISGPNELCHNQCIKIHWAGGDFPKFLAPATAKCHSSTAGKVHRWEQQQSFGPASSSGAFRGLFHSLSSIFYNVNRHARPGFFVEAGHSNLIRHWESSTTGFQTLLQPANC